MGYCGLDPQFAIPQLAILIPIQAVASEVFIPDCEIYRQAKPVFNAHGRDGAAANQAISQT